MLNKYTILQRNITADESFKLNGMKEKTLK